VSATVIAVDDPIARARDAAMPDASDVAKYRAYVLGTQPVTLSTEMQTDLAGILGNGYVDNLCRLAVQSFADFLKLARIDIDADDSPDKEALAEFINDTWTLNQVPELSSDVHFAAPRDGNYAVAASWDNRTGRVRFSQLDWWNGTRGAFVHYDDGGLPDWAVYEWQEYDPETQTTIGGASSTTPSAWSGTSASRAARGSCTTCPTISPKARCPQRPGRCRGWTLTASPSASPSSPSPTSSSPTTSPARPRGSSRGGMACPCSLAGRWACRMPPTRRITTSSRRLGARRSRSSGAPGALPTTRKDGTTSQGIPIVATPGMMLTNPSDKAQFGMLLPGDMSQLLNVLTDHHRTFARMTNTPMQIVAETDKDAASGVALLRMQLAAIRQARRAATVFGSRWGMLFHKAVNIANAFGKAELNADLMLVGVFDPIEASDAAVMAEVARDMRDAGFPMRFILRTMGQTDEMADEVMGWLEEGAGRGG
jgi:hypothetical protein